MNSITMMRALLGAMALAVPGAWAAEQDASPPPGSAASKTAGLFSDAVVAKGKGFEIKRSQVDEALVLVRANFASTGQPFPEARRKQIEAKLLSNLIATRLLLEKGTDEDRARARTNSEEFVASMRTKASSEELFKLQLKAMGLTPEQFRSRVLEQAICDEVVKREVRAQIAVSDEQIKKFYEDNPKEFEEPPMVRAAHILISTKDPSDPTRLPRFRKDLPEEQILQKKNLAESLQARLKKGEDFAKLVKEFSDDPVSKDKGGEYTFPRGGAPPEFEAATFSLSLNQVSDLVKTENGFHIIKLLEKIPAKKKPLAEAREDIKTFLQSQDLQKRLPAYIEKLKKEREAVILDQSLDLKDEPDSGPPTGPAK